MNTNFKKKHPTVNEQVIKFIEGNLSTRKKTVQSNSHPYSPSFSYHYRFCVTQIRKRTRALLRSRHPWRLITPPRTRPTPRIELGDGGSPALAQTRFVEAGVGEQSVLLRTHTCPFRAILKSYKHEEVEKKHRYFAIQK